MIVELISVGTEILMGNIVNTNSAYLSEKCAQLGLALYNQVTVGDNPDRLFNAVKTALKRADTVILTGGLGPTKDDLTKEITAKALNKGLVRSRKWEKKITDYFSQRDIENFSKNNLKQADVIEGAEILDNPNGTAPGEIASNEEGKTVILLPGPPGEMIPMFEAHVFPYLKKQTSQVFVSKMVKLCGIGESSAETQILDLIESQTNPTIAPYAKTCEVHFRITASGRTEEEGEAIAAPMVEELYRRFGNHIYTTNEEETLEAHIISLLKEKNKTVTTAESVTGGAIAAMLVNVPGASQVFKEGYITYSNEAKIKNLDVKPETIENYGVVSAETAKEMALGAVKRSGADVSIAVTGIAGPDGGTKEKPAGLVYIGCCIGEKVKVEKFQFIGNRQKVRESAAASALSLIRSSLLSE